MKLPDRLDDLEAGMVLRALGPGHGRGADAGRPTERVEVREVDQEGPGTVVHLEPRQRPTEGESERPSRRP